MKYITLLTLLNENAKFLIYPKYFVWDKILSKKGKTPIIKKYAIIDAMAPNNNPGFL